MRTRSHVNLVSLSLLTDVVTHQQSLRRRRTLDNIVSYVEEDNTMTVNGMRSYICQHPKYRHNEHWKNRVMHIPDYQVIAIYNRFKNLDFEKEAKEEYHQVSIFEYMRDKEAQTKCQQ